MTDLIGYTYPHHLPTKPLPTYGKAPCEEPGCITVCSTYSEPQPLTGARLCSLHWRQPEGYTTSPTGRTVKEAA